MACAAGLAIAASAWYTAAAAQTFYPAPPVPGAAANAPLPAASSTVLPAPGVPRPGTSVMGAPSGALGSGGEPPPAPPAIGAPPVTPPNTGAPPLDPSAIGATPGPVTRGSFPPLATPQPPPFAVPRPPPPMAPTSEPVKGLPADAPQLVISGGVYSANPQQRRLIVNGKVVKEGADLGSGMVLEQITPVVAVLAFRGAHYRVVY